MSPRTVTELRTCSVDGCDRKHVARGWCHLHYGRWYANEHPRPYEPRQAWRKDYEARNRPKVLAWKRKSSKKYRERNPDAWRENALRRKYGITPEDYDRLLAEQGGTCALCDTKPRVGKRLDIDHDAETGVVRGLLCRPHNMGLGYFRDTPALLRAAAEYLERS